MLLSWYLWIPNSYIQVIFHAASSFLKKVPILSSAMWWVWHRILDSASFLPVTRLAFLQSFFSTLNPPSCRWAKVLSFELLTTVTCRPFDSWWRMEPTSMLLTWYVLVPKNTPIRLLCLKIAHYTMPLFCTTIVKSTHLFVLITSIRSREIILPFTGRPWEGTSRLPNIFSSKGLIRICVTSKTSCRLIFASPAGQIHSGLFVKFWRNEGWKYKRD